MVAWGPIIGAGISAIGSLFGGGDDETTTTVNYKQMAKAAEKAGFNPLTVLRNGGSAGFTTTSHPALSGWTGFAQTIGNALMAFDPRADERAALEDKLLQAQLESVQRSNTAADARAMWSFDVPTAAASTRVGPNGRPVEPDGSPEHPFRAMDTYIRADGTTFQMPSNQMPDADQALAGAAANQLDIQETRPKVKPWWDFSGMVPNGKPQGNPPGARYQGAVLSAPEWVVPTDDGFRVYEPLSSRNPYLGNRGW